MFFELLINFKHNKYIFFINNFHFYILLYIYIMCHLIYILWITKHHTNIIHLIKLKVLKKSNKCPTLGVEPGNTLLVGRENSQ